MTERSEGIIGHSPTVSAVSGIDGDRQRLRQALLGHGLKIGEGVDRLRRRLAWLLDCHEPLLSSQYLPVAGRLVWAATRPYTPDLVGGPTMTADPLTAAVLYEAAADNRTLGGFSIRRAPKRYGLRKLVEGQPIVPGGRVVLLDDVISSGRSLIRAHDVVASAGATVTGAVVLVDFGRRRLRRLDRLGLPVRAIFTLGDLGLRGRRPARTGTAGTGRRPL
jgi:orotate phosphoribosyltransferase